MSHGATGRLRAAIVGSGPSGFYAAEALLKLRPDVEISMFERLPVPYGLVRSGVAPDHPKLKQAIKVFEKIAASPAFRFFGNVCVGQDISTAEILGTHHFLIIACGAELDRRLDIPGEDLAGSHSATEFVGWYNGHPDYRDREFDLSQPSVAIIGQGNVALDVARILAKPVRELAHTDMANHALKALASSRVTDIHVFGRRGPAQARFTPTVLGEFLEIDGCTPLVEPQQLALSEQCQREIADPRNSNSAMNIARLRRFADVPGGGRVRCWFHFFTAPLELIGNRSVKALRLTKTTLKGEAFQQTAEPAGAPFTFPCGLVIRAVGHRGAPVPGLPFDHDKGIIPNRDGRVLGDKEAPLPGIYVTGWIKRGATGIIGNNRADSLATIEAIKADLPLLECCEKRGADTIEAMLASRQVRSVNFSGWQRIDQAEVTNGSVLGKPREKITRIGHMLAVAQAEAASTAASGIA